jgi:HK97 family phage prohead protease/HK97 family phage major capsid protein
MNLKKNYQAKLLSNIESVEKSEDSDELIITGYANTVTKDRAGDIIPKSAWESPNALTNYTKNPIILAFHNHSNPIGKMVDYEITELGLKIKASISKGAGNVYQLIKDGILQTFSVGFRLLDADYDSKTDTYYINDLELTEVSVVSVPCNQDSVFSVAKSMESNEDFNSFKNTFIKEKEENPMTEKELQEMREKMQAQILADIQAKAEAEAKEKELTEKRIAEARKAAKEEAESLVKELQDSLKQVETGNSEAFEKMVKQHEEAILDLKDELAQSIKAQQTSARTAVSKAVVGGVESKDADDLVMLRVIKGQKDVFATNYGKSFEKAVNGSSSIQVSSEDYETTFSTNLIRDIQAELVVAPLFTEMPMNTAQLTIPINPDRGSATWVSAANMADGSSKDRTGAEHTVALTEKTLKTWKLAAKSYLTEETEEDTILALVPIMRQHLVEAHAAAIDNAFLIGDGVGKPKGLVTQAAGNSKAIATAAKADGSVKVTALMIQQQRRELGLYGVDIKGLKVVVSQDAYWDLIEDPEWADVQQVRDAATKLKGEVGNIYGMPVIVSNEYAAKAVDTAYAVIVAPKNFVVPRLRGVTLRSDFDIETDRRVFVATQRLNLEPLIEGTAGNGKGVVALKYAAV